MAEEVTAPEPTTEESESVDEPFISFSTKAEYEQARKGWRQKATSGRDKQIAQLQTELDELRETEEAKGQNGDALATATAKWDRQQKKWQADLDEAKAELGQMKGRDRDRSILDFAQTLARAANVPADWAQDAAVKLLASAEFEVQEDGSIAVQDADKQIPLVGKQAEAWATERLKGSAFLQARPTPSPAPGAGNPGRPGPSEKPFAELSAVDQLNRLDGIG